MYLLAGICYIVSWRVIIIITSAHLVSSWWIVIMSCILALLAKNQPKMTFPFALRAYKSHHCDPHQTWHCWRFGTPNQLRLWLLANRLVQAFFSKRFVLEPTKSAKVFKSKNTRRSNSMTSISPSVFWVKTTFFLGISQAPTDRKQWWGETRHIVFLAHQLRGVLGNGLKVVFVPGPTQRNLRKSSGLLGGWITKKWISSLKVPIFWLKTPILEKKQ